MTCIVTSDGLPAISSRSGNHWCRGFADQVRGRGLDVDPGRNVGNLAVATVQREVHGAIEDVERGEQTPGAMPHVGVCVPRARVGIIAERWLGRARLGVDSKPER